MIETGPDRFNCLFQILRTIKYKGHEKTEDPLSHRRGTVISDDSAKQ